MKTLFYSTQDFEKIFLKKEEERVISSQKENLTKSVFHYIPCSLNSFTVDLAESYDAISIATADDGSALILERLAKIGVRKIAIRAAGFDKVDQKKAKELGFQIANVPDYSPNAIAEHTLTLILNLARKIKISERQVKEHDFRTENLVGFEIHKKTVGIIGTGRIGGQVAKILSGFGAKILAYDLIEQDELRAIPNFSFTSLDTLIKESDIITIHTGLYPSTWHLIDQKRISQMKDGIMIINTDRGACLDTKAIIEGLKTKKIGFFGADVYEFEKGMFFHDLRKSNFNDEIMDELLSMDNVIITPHQAFATHEALTNIASSTFKSLKDWDLGKRPHYDLF